MEYDAETYAAMRAYAGPDFDKPRKKTITVFEDSGSCEWTLKEFLELIEDARQKIPEPLRDTTAKVELEADYDSVAWLKISYQTVETADEVTARITTAQTHIDAKKAQERALYERLKAKYGAAS